MEDDEVALLHLAAELGLTDHIEVLLAFGVDVDIRSQVSALVCFNFLARLVI